jgi:hypothetical protein
MKTLGINSAKGAVIISSLGQRPRISSIAQLSALKARLFREIAIGLNHSVELRFQRWFTPRLESLGDAPGLDEGAPSALSNSSDRAFES